MRGGHSEYSEVSLTLELGDLAESSSQVAECPILI